MHIVSISAREIIASGGYPTIETTVTLDSGHTGTASVPYGASAGSHEASVLTDSDSPRYNGKGMLGSIQVVQDQLQPLLTNIPAEDQRAIDMAMKYADGTPQKTRFGGNAVLSVSLAVAKAAAAAKGMELYEHLQDHFCTPKITSLPKPMVVSIEGGKHADNSTDLQEFCLTATGNASIADSLRAVLESYHALRTMLSEKHYSTNVGNEGAFAPSGITTNEEPLQLLSAAIEKAGYQPGSDIGISLDAAASEFYKDEKYHLHLEKKQLDATELITYFEQWFKKYPITTVEDLLDEDDWDHWPAMNQLCEKHHIPLIGDDLTVTNSDRLQRAIQLNAISGILIKLNQIGTVTETMDTCELARKHNLLIVPSHRGGGETNDTSMVDVAVATGAGYIKVGPTRGERVAKYNRLLEIAQKHSL